MVASMHVNVLISGIRTMRREVLNACKLPQQVCCLKVCFVVHCCTCGMTPWALPAMCRNSHVLNVQVRHTCRRPLQAAWTCRAIVAPTTHTNGAALRAGKPVLENPLWHDSLQAESHSTAAQLYRQPKGMLPNRLRLFAGTANPVCRPLLCFAT